MRTRAAVAALSSVVLSLLVPGVAHALELGTPEQQRPYRSPQNFAFELRGSPYYPKVDEEPGLVGAPFRRSFGPDKRFELGLEFDWQILRVPHLGTLGVGAAFGVTSFGADAKLLSNGGASGDTMGLSIYPMWTVAVLRADAVFREAHIPFVPYGKIGLGGALWKATSTGETSHAHGVAGRGLSLGTQTAVGVAFALDALDPGTSRNADSAIGINGTYVFAEYYWLNLNGLFGSDSLRAGTNTWAVGLAWEF